MNRMIFDIAAKSACAVAQQTSIANMLDADQLAEDSSAKKYWHEEILMAID